MRTTVTLDKDAEALLRAAMKERSVSFKEALNTAIRAGLSRARERKRFVQKSFALGADQNFRWDKALATAAAMEDEELGRKLSVQK